MTALRSYVRHSKRPLSRIAAFSALPAISLVSNLVVLPLLSARFGVAGWSSVLLGQAVGAAASVVCALAWPTEGPHLVASTAPEGRLALYRSSLRQRSAAVLSAAPVVVVICVLAGRAYPMVSALAGLALTLNALSPGWFFAGLSKPSYSLMAEGIPRLAASLASIVLVSFLPLWTYPVALLMGTLGTLVVTWALAKRATLRSQPPAEPMGDSPPRNRKRRSLLLAVSARGADAGYSFLTGPLVAFVAPWAYPTYAAVDRLNTSIVNVMGPLTWGLTAWIGEGGSGRRRRRVIGATALAVTTAGAAWVLLFAATPLILHYLFAGTVHADWVMAALAATGMAGAWLARILIMVLLVPQGLAAWGYGATLCVSCLALAMVAVAAVGWGSTGAVAAVAIAALIAVSAHLTRGVFRLREDQETRETRS